nr:Peptidase C19 domain containing protein [Haemonchus contortus]
MASSISQFSEIDSSHDDCGEQEDHDIKIATLLSHGFEQPDVEIALRKSNNDVSKAYNLLSLNKEPVHDVFSSASEWSNEDHEAGPSSDNFPTPSFRCVRRAVNSDVCSIFSTHVSIMRCIEASQQLLTNNIFDPVCTEFVDFYLPKCISLHVNPPEPLFFNDVNLGISVDFCKEVVPLISRRLSKLPVANSLCHSMADLFNPRNKMFCAYRRLSPSEVQNRSFDIQITYCDIRKTMNGKDHTHRLLQELIDLFITSSGFSNVNEVLRNHRDVLTPRDIFELLCAIDSFRDFLDSKKMTHILLSIVEGSLNILNEVSEKYIRDALSRTHIIDVIDICTKWMELLNASSFSCDHCLLKFFLRCITCNQLDAKVFAFHELGKLVVKNRPFSSVFDFNLFNSWLKDNNILKHALQGNMDQPTYLEKIRPILSYMTSEMSASDLSGVWSLRKGRMGVSADNFSTILVQIGKGLNCEQIGWLEQLFIKCFHANETRMYDRIFLCCRDIGIYSEHPQISEKMLSIMWNLIGLARKKNFMTLNAVKWFIELVCNKKDLIIKDTYIRKCLDILTVQSGPIIVSSLVILRELLEMSSNIVSQAKNCKPSSRGFRSRDQWGDIPRLETNLDEVKSLLRDNNFAKVLYEKLASCKELAQKSVSDGLEDCEHITAVVISDGCTYSFAVKNILAVFKWLIQNQVVDFSKEIWCHLWDTLSSSGSNYSSEMALLFEWLTQFNVHTIKASTVTALLESFCTIPANRLTLDGLKSLCHLIDSIDDRRFRDQASTQCLEYLWEVLEVAENKEIVREVMQKLIEFGSRNNDCSQYRLFLSICYQRLDNLRTEYFRRIGQTACPSPNLSKSSASSDQQEVEALRNICRRPDSGCKGDVAEPQNSQETICEAMFSCGSSSPPNRSASELSPLLLLRGIDRLLQLIAIFVESEDNLFFMPRHFPPHGALVPGRPLRIYCHVEDDPSEENALLFHTNSHEAIGQFRSRLSNRLHFRSIGVYKIYVQKGDKSVEIPCSHEWKTLEQVGLASFRDGICELENIDVTIRCPRLSVSSVNYNSGRLISEKQLPGVIVHETNGVFAMLHELQKIADLEIQKSCRRILALIPVDPTVLAAFAVEESPPRIGRGTTNDAVVVEKFLTPSDPYRLLYTLEVLSGLLVPTFASKITVTTSNRLARILINSVIYKHLLKLIASPHLIAPITPSDRTRLFELLTLILRVLLLGQSVLSHAITHEEQCLSSLQNFKKSERRKDPLYEDLSTLSIESNEEFLNLIAILRDAIWRGAAGWLLYSIKLPIYPDYFGITPKSCETPNSAQTADTVWVELPICKVPDARSATESIRGSHAQALDNRSEALTNDLLLLMVRCINIRLNTSELDQVVKENLLKLCTSGSWREFWLDILLNTVTSELRRHARDALMCIVRCPSLGSNICQILALLLETVESPPFSRERVKKMDELSRRKLANSLEMYLCLASILEYNRSNSEEDILHIWRLVKRDPMQIAWEIFDYVINTGSSSTNDYINADFMYAKLRVLRALLKYSSPEARKQMGEKFMVPMLGCCVFAQVLQGSFSSVWGGKNPLFALEVLSDLTEGCVENAFRLIEWLQNYFGTLRELEWEYRPVSESRVLDHVGLQNGGGTCYMNSVLQQLFAIPGLANHLLSIEVSNDREKENNQLLLALQSVFARLTMTRSRLYVPREMWETFRFTGADRLDTRQQHDAVDFFTELIDRVDSALEAEKKPLLFRPRLRGKFSYEYICYGCFHRHIGADEEFLAVNLELHGPSLEECLEHYVNGELLEGDNAYFCSKCQEKRNTLRRGSFCELPNTLAIQLKRFSYDINGRVDKKNDFCSFPMVLDMTSYCTQARAVCDQDLKSLFDDVYSSEQEDSSSIGEEEVKCQESHHSPSSPSRWGRKRRKTSSLPNLNGVESYLYELVGVVVHSGGARAGHYVSYVKERRPEMYNTFTYGQWVELNDAEVRIFSGTPEAMECEWFGGSFTASPNAAFPSRVDLPKERLRSFSAYVLLYEKKEARSTAVIHMGDTPRLPNHLFTAVESENMSFLKERDLFSSTYGYAVCKTVTNFVAELEFGDSQKNEENSKMAVVIFRMFFDYCRNALWRLSYESREARLFEFSFESIRRLIRCSSSVRQEFFQLLVNCNYQIFYTMFSSPDDVCSAWWRLVGDALCEWVEDFDYERLPKSSAKLPQEIVARIITQIKCVDSAHTCCIHGAVRCLNSFARSSHSAAIRLIGAGIMPVICEHIANEWSVSTRIQGRGDLRSNRQLTVDFLSLYATLLVHIRDDPCFKKEFPLENGDSFTSVLVWMYIEFSTDKRMCHVIEEIFCLIEQIRPNFLESVVNFLLMELGRVECVELAKEIVRFVVNICRRLDDGNVSNAFRYFAILLDGCERSDFINESEVPKGLISQAEELLVHCEYDRVRVILESLARWKEEGTVDRRIAEVYNEADRFDRIACCTLRLAEEESAAIATGVVGEVGVGIHREDPVEIYYRNRISKLHKDCGTDEAPLVDVIPHRNEYEDDIDEDDGIGLSPPSLTPTITEFDDVAEQE